HTCAETSSARTRRANASRPLARIIASLGIPQVGWQTAIDLSTWIVRAVPPGEDEPMGGPTGWLARSDASRRGPAPNDRDRFPEVMGVAPTVAAAVTRWFTEPASRGVLTDL